MALQDTPVLSGRQGTGLLLRMWRFPVRDADQTLKIPFWWREIQISARDHRQSLEDEGDRGKGLARGTEGKMALPRMRWACVFLRVRMLWLWCESWTTLRENMNTVST